MRDERQIFCVLEALLHVMTFRPGPPHEEQRVSAPVPHAWPLGPVQIAEIPPQPDGLSSKLAHRGHAIRATGNAVVPQCAELIFRAINRLECGGERDC